MNPIPAALRGLALAGALALLTACAVSSVPISYLQLSDGSPPAAGSDVPVVYLQDIKLPDYLLRDELLIRDTEYELRYDINQRWSEPLDLGVQRVIASRLEHELDTRQVFRFPDLPRATPEWQLRIELQRFETIGNEVVLRAEGRWEAAAEPGVTRAVVPFEKTALLGTVSDAEIARQMSELLWQFSSALAEGLRASPTEGTAQVSPQ